MQTRYNHAGTRMPRFFYSSTYFVTRWYYDPALNPLYRDVLAHYGVTALPCKVRNPDRKGEVESGVKPCCRGSVRTLSGLRLWEPMRGTRTNLKGPISGPSTGVTRSGSSERVAPPRHFLAWQGKPGEFEDRADEFVQGLDSILIALSWRPLSNSASDLTWSYFVVAKLRLNRSNQIHRYFENMHIIVVWLRLRRTN